MEIPDPDVSFFDDDDSLAAKPGILSLSWWGRTLGSVKSWFGLNTDHSTVSDDLDRISVIGTVLFFCRNYIYFIKHSDTY